MDPQRIYIWLSFFFCLALAAGGSLIFFQKKEIKSIPASRYFQYFLILIYMFGFYSLWSKVFLTIFFDQILLKERLSNLPEYIALLGIPFLVSGMLMLLLWAVSLLQKRLHRLFLPAAVLIICLILLVYMTYKRFDIIVNVHQVYALFVFLITAFTALLLFFSDVDYLDKKPKNILILLVFLSGFIHVPVFIDQMSSLTYELLFIFLFFFINTFTGIYYAYTVKAIQVHEDISVFSFDAFIKEYGITTRESEIIREIYNGKTNQEIADRLFVTVQTIKDHTSRIYLKTNMKNRAQLTSFLRKYE